MIHYQILFPKDEWNDIRARLDDGKVVYTVRVSDEYGKYKEEDVLVTEWGSKVEIISVKRISGGIKELERVYPYFDQLTDEMIKELIPFDDMEIISLKMVDYRV